MGTQIRTGAQIHPTSLGKYLGGTRISLLLFAWYIFIIGLCAMAAEDGRPQTYEWVQRFARDLGPRKTGRDRATPEDWQRAFAIVREKDRGTGWKTALAQWANVDPKTVWLRWRSNDTSVHRLGRPPLLSEAEESHLIEIANMGACASNSVTPAEFRGALHVVATATHTAPVGGSKGHLRRFYDRHPDFTHRRGERTLSTRALGMTRLGYALLMENLNAAGIRDIPARKCINVDEANVFVVHNKVYVVGPRSKVLKHLCAREADCTVHVSIVGAVTAEGWPFGKPIFIVAGKQVPPALAGARDDYLLITSPGGGQTKETWEACCTYWTSIAEGHEIFVFDGHGSHKDFMATEILAAKTIQACTLVPNSSQDDQVRMRLSGGRKCALNAMCSVAC